MSKLTDGTQASSQNRGRRQIKTTPPASKTSLIFIHFFSQQPTTPTKSRRPFGLRQFSQSGYGRRFRRHPSQSYSRRAFRKPSLKPDTNAATYAIFHHSYHGVRIYRRPLRGIPPEPRRVWGIRCSPLEPGKTPRPFGYILTPGRGATPRRPGTRELSA